MYSRRFSNGSELPPDYAGVAFRQDAQKTDQAGREDRTERTDTRPFDAERPSERSFEAPRDRRLRDERNEPSERRDYIDREEAYDRRQPPSPPQGQSGGLSSLFSLGGRSFSLEDVILAGLILLLLGDRDGTKKPDGELLLILGLLLLSK